MVPQNPRPNLHRATSLVTRPPLPLAQALWMAGFWVLMTVAMTLQFWLRRREDLTEALLFAAVQWLPWALFTPVFFWLSEYYTLEKGRWQRTMWVHLGASLVSIASLVHEDPRKADEMIGSLSELLRQTLGAADRQETTLHEELSLLDRYLAIERVRFGDRLRIETQIEPDALDALVPILILQPLVENAIKHGIERQLGQGIVRIVARRDGESLVLAVADNGRGLAAQEGRALKEGVGLSNTRSRIEALGARVGSLQLRSPAAGGLVAEVRLPWRPAPGRDTLNPSLGCLKYAAESPPAPPCTCRLFRRFLPGNT